MYESKDVGIEIVGHVAVVEMRRPPYNYFDLELMRTLGQVFEDIDQDPALRAIVLCAQGSAFCAGADFNTPGGPSREVYPEAARLFATRKPVVGAIQGPAIGGGLGLAVVADFRVAAPEARFAANFVKLGIHPGFGLTHTLPRLLGMQKAALLMYTGRRLNGEQALAWGLVDELVDLAELRPAALRLATEIAEAAPLAVIATRATLRQGLFDAFRDQVRHESDEQTRLLATADSREGIRAVNERRPGRFIGA
jgi:enoyl-CoA hydratase/carnithine racemase